MTTWDNLTRTLRAFDKATESSRKIQEALHRTRDMHFQNKLDFTNKLLESLHNKGSLDQQLQEQIDRIGSTIPYDATTKIARELNKLTQLSYNPLQEITESLNKTQTILNFDHLLKENLISEIELVAESINFKQLKIDEYGSITLGQETAVAEEVAETIKNFTKILENHKPTEATSKLLNFIDGLKKPLKALVLYIIFTIFMPFIVSVMSNIYAPDIESFIKTVFNQNVTIKQIQKKAQNNFGNQILDGMAFVSTDSLNVREHPRCKSKIITIIHKGKVVRIIEKHRKWTQVSFEDEQAGELITGWVFSRYIYKLYI